MLTVEKALNHWAQSADDKNKEYYNDDFNPLQMACAIGSEDVVNYLMDEGCEVNLTETPDITVPAPAKSYVLPKLSPLHLAVYSNNIELISVLAEKADINFQDQLGFTALHYATLRRNKDIVLLLLDLGASAIIESKLGNTALDLSKQLGHDEITDVLQSKTNKELDPLLPQFKEWLSALSATEYLSAFVEAGYDLSFIAAEGLTEEDLDCCGIPVGKLGLRRKLLKLHRLDEFYEAEDDEDDEDEDEEDEDEDEEDEDEDDEDEDED